MSDTARFLTALMQGRLLSPTMLDSMRTRSFWSGGDMPAGGGRDFGHSGGGSGYTTDVWVRGDGDWVAVRLRDGRAADAVTGDKRAAQALAALYCSA